ncbi:MAG TPA: hypothetical protein VF720_04770 [Candidatus Eisenbacteria bacterium]
MMIVLGLTAIGCQRTTPTPQTATPDMEPAPAEPVEPPPPDVVGNWTITGHHIPGTSAMTDAEAAAWHGRTVRLGSALIVAGEQSCSTPRYESHRVYTQPFLAKAYKLAPGSLEPLSARERVVVTESYCGRKRFTGPGAIMIGLDDNHALAPWDGVFFELTRGPSFRAIGQEPGWALDFRDDGTMRFEYGYGESAVTAGITRPTVDPDTKIRTWKTAAAGGDLVVTVEPKPCADAMSGLPFETTVTVTYGGTTYQGCGWTMPR